MALKLVLLSNNAIEELQKDAYKNFEAKIQNNSIKLSEEQKKSLKKMNVSNQKFRVHVLQGTTGSGKTMVYFEAIKDIINKGFQGLILLPEIGLTGQFEKKIHRIFWFYSSSLAFWYYKKKRKKLFGVELQMEKLKLSLGLDRLCFYHLKN